MGSKLRNRPVANRCAGVGVGLLAAALTIGAADAQDELVFPLDDAPAEALAVAQAAAPDVTFTGVDVEVEDGVVTLEFAGQRADGASVEVDVTLGWSVLEVEDVISIDEVPAAVLETLAIQMGDFKPALAERSQRGETTVYEFEGVDADGREIDIEIQAEGESIVVLDDEDT
ncbi:MAG: hypothetical protein AAFQ67_07575 [Pseudomonadota bacterium]